MPADIYFIGNCQLHQAPLNLLALRMLPWAEKDHKRSEHSSTSLSDADPGLLLPPEIVEGLLVRLAGVGLSPTSLSLLAGIGRWQGFAGLLSTASVTNDLHILVKLYTHFKRIYK